MRIDDDAVYKVVAYLPESHLDIAMDAVNESMESLFPNYDRTFSHFPVTGTWRSLEGSNPYSGEAGRISSEPELRLEFGVRGRDLLRALRALRDVHPYEEPAIDVFPMLAARDLLD